MTPSAIPGGDGTLFGYHDVLRTPLRLRPSLPAVLSSQSAIGFA